MIYFKNIKNLIAAKDFDDWIVDPNNKLLVSEIHLKNMKLN